MTHFQPMKKATISDVAKLAKTGKTSVSRYLNGEFAVLSEQLTQRIKSAIKELNYSPNQMARSLKRGRTKLIALLVADIKNPYSVDIMRGVEAACQDNGYTLLVCNTNKEQSKEKYFLKLLLDYNVEGAIVHSLKTNNSLFNDLPFPVVLVDRSIPDGRHDIVGLDNRQSAELSSNYLIDRGFEAILFITEPIAGINSRTERVNAFRKTLKQHPSMIGNVVEINQLDDSNKLDEAILAFCQKCLGMRKAIMTVNGSITLHVSLAMKRLNLVWGRDIGFLGFDDPIWAPVIGCGITTLKQPTYQIGYSSFEMLLKRIEGDTSEAKQLLYPGELVIRDSTS